MASNAARRSTAMAMAIARNYPSAEKHLSTVITASGDAAEAGWLMEQTASYINHTDPA